jgi:DNA-binding SARP family transcriptional activator
VVVIRAENGVACLAIVDGSGRVLWRSDALRARAREADGFAADGARRCCALLNCAGNTADGEPRCLTTLALDAGGELPPREWQSGPAAPRLEGTLAGQALHAASGPIVVFELTLDEAATAPPEPVADLQVQALGPLSVRVGDEQLDGDWLQQQPGRVFRYLLVARSGAVRSEGIADALWPDRGPAAVANVRYCIYKVRETLDSRPSSARSVILRNAGGYRIDPRRLVLDVDLFQSRVLAGLRAYRGGDARSAEALLAEGLDAYRGDFLADDPYAEWAFTEREYLHGLAGEALAAGARIAAADNRLQAAAARLLRLTQLEPFDSQAHRTLIEVCLRRGRRTEAMRHYNALRLRLARTFGEQPDFELSHVVSELARRAA